MSHPDAGSDAWPRPAAARLAAPPRVLVLQTPSGRVRYPVLEVTADPSAWFIETALAARLPEGVYPAVLEHGSERTPGEYTVVSPSSGRAGAALAPPHLSGRVRAGAALSGSRPYRGPRDNRISLHPTPVDQRQRCPCGEHAFSRGAHDAGRPCA